MAATATVEVAEVAEAAEVAAEVDQIEPRPAELARRVREGGAADHQASPNGRVEGGDDHLRVVHVSYTPWWCRGGGRGE